MDINMNHKTIILIIAFLILFTGCAPKAPPAQEITACTSEFYLESMPLVVTALGRELAAISDSATPIATCLSGDVTVYRASYYGVEFNYFDLTGFGPGAEKDLDYVLNNFLDVQIVIYVGISGGLDSNLEILSVVVPEFWSEQHTGNSVKIENNLIQIVKDNQLAIVTSSGVTAKEYVTNGPDVFKATGASIVDMESYNLAVIAKKHNNVPFIVFSSISNDADGVKVESTYDAAAHNSAVAGLKFLTFYLR